MYTFSTKEDANERNIDLSAIKDVIISGCFMFEISCKGFENNNEKPVDNSLEFGEFEIDPPSIGFKIKLEDETSDIISTDKYVLSSKEDELKEFDQNDDGASLMISRIYKENNEDEYTVHVVLMNATEINKNINISLFFGKKPLETNEGIAKFKSLKKVDARAIPLVEMARKYYVENIRKQTLELINKTDKADNWKNEKKIEIEKILKKFQDNLNKAESYERVAELGSDVSQEIVDLLDD